MSIAPPGDRHLPYVGLTAGQVQASRTQHGANLLTPPQRQPWWRLFLEKFEDPIIRILMIAATIALAAGVLQGEYAEGVGIIAAILLATVVAFVNEFKANQEFSLLNQVYDQVLVKVIRDGQYVRLSRQELVVGDILYIEQGQEIPADATILESVSLYVDQAKLTGESEPAVKSAADSPPPEDVESTTYPFYMVYRSTLVTQGHGYCEIIAVGDRTEIGKLAEAIATVEDNPETPLNQQLDSLSQVIGVAGLTVALLTFMALLLRGILTQEMILSRPHAYVITGILTTVLIVLMPIWIPILEDGEILLLRLFGWREESAIEVPAPLKNTAITLLSGSLWLGSWLGLGVAQQWLTPTPSDWLPLAVGLRLLSYFMVAVTIIVVAVPEGLAMSVTLSLAYSMRRMMANNNLVRRMHACETIGATTIICSDKTGTLTCNQMRVQASDIPALVDATTSQAERVHRLMAEAIAANSTADLEYASEDQPAVIGNATEGALLLWLNERNIDYLAYRYNFELTSRSTFSAERKYMSSYGQSSVLGSQVLFVKGAPEVVLGFCAYELTATGQRALTNQEAILERLREFQNRGMRTLGLAYRPIESPEAQHGLELKHGLTWLGFFALIDPLREDVPQAIADCLNAGIQVKIVTGDSPQTAMEIGRQIGLWQTEEEQACLTLHLTGPEFEAMDDETALVALDSLRILSRACPLDKLRLVRLLQQKAAVVGVTGDGTNDAAALKQAQVGLAMGSGTAIAKEASDIILLDDSFSSIVSAVLWGRSLYENIQKFLLFQLTITVVALGTALLGPFIGVELPFTVTQMLWVNLIMDTFAALALATEPPNPAVLGRSPRPASAFIITAAMAKRIAFVGLGFLLLTVGMLKYLMNDGEISNYELSVFFAVFVFLQLWNLFNVRCFGLPISAFSGLSRNPAFVGIVVTIFMGQVAIVQWGGSIFRTVPLSLRDWGLIIGGTSVVLWLGEIWRQLRPQISTAKSD